MNYSPLPAPSDTNALASYLFQEMLRLSQSLSEPQKVIRLSASHAEPVRPREGMIALADGTDWNPGSGAGYYGYYGSAWVKLG